MRIRALQEEDAPAFVALRIEALLDSPLAFASAPGDDVASDVEFVRRQMRESKDWTLFGAFSPDLVGSVGMMRDTHLKSAHKANVYGMYVTPEQRRSGVGAALLQAVIARAREMSRVAWIHLSVSASAEGALALYRASGFEIWGTEPDALRHAGDSVDEHHMVLRL
jgi:ribosomal protein S18 acetylase RimI-like enzyme